MNASLQATVQDTPQSIALEVQQAVTSFFELHAQMANLMKEENELLKARHFAMLNEITERKGHMIAAYQDVLRYLQHNAAVVKSLSNEVKARLAAMRQEMADLTSDNMTLLDRAMKSSERVVTMIVDAMKSAKRSSTFYGQSGAVAEDLELSRNFTVNSVV